MQANSCQLFQFHLIFWIWQLWKGRGKITKKWISREQKELFRWHKKHFLKLLKWFLSVKYKNGDTSCKGTSKFDKIDIGESKKLKYLKNMEKRIIGLLKILKEKSEISHPVGSELRILYMSWPKFKNLLLTIYPLFALSCQPLALLLPWSYWYKSYNS